MKYVVIGTSAAGIGCLSRLKGDITCISASSEMPYNTCLLADFLSGDRDELSIFTKKRSFFEDIDLRLSTTVSAIDTGNKLIITDKGNFAYDALFLGLGTSIQIPPIPGAEKAYRFHTLSDTYRLLNKIGDIKVATIIGAGLSGVECSDALAAHGIKVNLIEQQGALLPSQVDKEGSKVIENLMPEHGVTFYPNTTVTEIHDNKVVTNFGELDTDITILTTGGKPNTHIIDLEVEHGGIVVDDYMQTSVKDIYAGGDIATVKNQLGGRARSTMWPDAMQQGMCAALAMMGQPKKYPGVLIIGSSNFYGITFVSCGPIVNPPKDHEVIIHKDTDYYHKFLVKGDILTGFLMVNNVNHLGVLRRAMLTKESFNEVLKSIS